MSEFMPETTPVYAQESRVREDQNPRHLWRGNFNALIWVNIKELKTDNQNLDRKINNVRDLTKVIEIKVMDTIMPAMDRDYLT